MNLRQLEMLLAVAEFGGYSKAAEQLNVSHSAIHRQIRILEEELQERILARAGKHVELTEAGLMLHQLALRIREEISKSLIRVRDLAELRHGDLRLGTGGTILASFLPGVLRLFRSQYPNISVHVAIGTADDIASEIENGNLDLGIIFPRAHVRKGMRPLCSELLYREEFVLTAGKDHPLANKKRISPADLSDVPLISYSKTSYVRQTLERLLRSAGVTPMIAMELESEDSIATMVESNMGVGILSKRRALRDGLHSFELRNRRILCDVRLSFPKLDYVPRAVREFARMCREESRKYSAG